MYISPIYKYKNKITEIKSNIHEDVIDWIWFSKQPHFIDIIEQYLDYYVCWTTLSSNPNAIHIIKMELERVNYCWTNTGNRIDKYWLASNPNAIPIIDELLESDKSDFKKLVYHDEIFWYILSSNPNAYLILKKNIKKINWEILAINTNITFILSNLFNETSNDIEGIPIIKDNEVFIKGISLIKDKQLFIKELASNSNAIGLYEKNVKEICGINFFQQHKYELSQNLNAISIIKKNKNAIDWECLSSNSNAIDFINDKIKIELDEEYNRPYKKIRTNYNDSLENKSFKNIDWDKLSGNTKAIDILKKAKDKINWNKFSENPKAINILKQNLDKVSWYDLSLNPNAIEMFDHINLENLRKEKLIDYLVKIKYINKSVSNNYTVECDDYSDFMKDFDDYFPETENIKIKIPRLKGNYLNNIFKVDYKFLKYRMDSTIKEELMQVMFHPKNIDKFKYWGIDDYDYD